jgi:hypothetical protein
MASARQASAFPHENEFLEALDGLADMVPARRSVQALRPAQHLQGWVAYADKLETRLAQVYEQFAAERADRLVHSICCRGPDASASAPHPQQQGEDDRLELLARVRAEQLMCVRLLNVLARCASLDLLQDPHGEAAAMLDAQRRRELRARDLHEARAEHHALRQAQRAQALRARDGEGAKRLSVPGLCRDVY